eukprot:9235300-Pyramimonas_sp.AAC.1
MLDNARRTKSGDVLPWGPPYLLMLALWGLAGPPRNRGQKLEGSRQPIRISGRLCRHVLLCWWRGGNGVTKSTPSVPVWAHGQRGRSP